MVFKEWQCTRQHLGIASHLTVPEDIDFREYAAVSLRLTNARYSDSGSEGSGGSGLGREHRGVRDPLRASVNPTIDAYHASCLTSSIGGLISLYSLS